MTALASAEPMEPPAPVNSIVRPETIVSILSVTFVGSKTVSSKTNRIVYPHLGPSKLPLDRLFISSFCR